MIQCANLISVLTTPEFVNRIRRRSLEVNRGYRKQKKIVLKGRRSVFISILVQDCIELVDIPGTENPPLIVIDET